MKTRFGALIIITALLHAGCSREGVRRSQPTQQSSPQEQRQYLVTLNRAGGSFSLFKPGSNDSVPQELYQSPAGGEHYNNAAFNPEYPYLYLTYNSSRGFGITNQGGIQIYKIENDSLALVQDYPFGWGLSGLAVGKDGKHLYMTNNGRGRFDVFNVDVTTGVISRAQRTSTGTNLFPFALSMSSDGTELFCGKCMTTGASRYTINPTNGEVSFIHGTGRIGYFEDGQAVQFAHHPGKKIVYAAMDYNNKIAALKTNPVDGHLEAFSEYQFPSGGLNFTTSVAVSYDGSTLFAAQYHTPFISVFPLNAGTGQLGTPVAIGVDGVPTLMVAHSSKNILYAVFQELNELRTYQFDGQRRSLTLLSTNNVGTGPMALAFGTVKLQARESVSDVWQSAHHRAVATESRPAIQQMKDAFCSRVQECNPGIENVASDCQYQIEHAADSGEALLGPGFAFYDTTQDLASAESSGALRASTNKRDSCATRMNQVSCTESQNAADAFKYTFSHTTSCRTIYAQ